jgi:hypothetical protein
MHVFSQLHEPQMIRPSMSVNVLLQLHLSRTDPRSSLKGEQCRYHSHADLCAVLEPCMTGVYLSLSPDAQARGKELKIELKFVFEGPQLILRTFVPLKHKLRRH